MKTLGKIFLFAPLFAFLLLSCSDEAESVDDLVKEGDFKISELAGNWEATYANFNDGAQQSVDVVGDGGTVSMTVQSSGRFTITINPADRDAYTASGEMFWEEFEGDYYFAIEWDDAPGDWDTYGATLTATTFSINGGFDSAEYDFDNDGTFEECSLSIGFDRV
jgi:hypothetical protein